MKSNLNVLLKVRFVEKSKEYFLEERQMLENHSKIPRLSSGGFKSVSHVFHLS